jgi:hypothetical protein
MKKLFYFSICLFLAVACKQADVAPETPKNKVSITFGNIKDGDWIQIDDLPQLPHLLDTIKFKDLPDGSVFVRSSYPQWFPMESLQDYLWISQSWGIGLISNRWLGSSETLSGLPAYSLYYHLVYVRQVSDFYGKRLTPEGRGLYNITFQPLSKEEFDKNIQNYIYSKEFNQLCVLTIERLDGKPIKIQTSEGYDAKIKYQ